MPREAKVAVSTFYSAFAALLVVAYEAADGAAATPSWVSPLAKASAVVLLIGQLLCWRAGWRRYNAGSAPFAGRRIDKFIVYVFFAPFTLPFSTITFPPSGV